MSFNLKISCILGGARFLQTLNISVARMLLFLSWTETKPLFSKKALKSDSHFAKKIFLYASMIVLQKWWKILFVSS